jgi:hypothetical protein
LLTSWLDTLSVLASLVPDNLGAFLVESSSLESVGTLEIVVVVAVSFVSFDAGGLSFLLLLFSGAVLIFIEEVCRFRSIGKLGIGVVVSCLYRKKNFLYLG